jgi:hypothetical protein
MGTFASALDNAVDRFSAVVTANAAAPVTPVALPVPQAAPIATPPIDTSRFFAPDQELPAEDEECRVFITAFSKDCARFKIPISVDKITTSLEDEHLTVDQIGDLDNATIEKITGLKMGSIMRLRTFAKDWYLALETARNVRTLTL